MHGVEKWFIIWALAYMVVYIPFFVFCTRSPPTDEFFFQVLLPLHFLGMVQNLVALILTIRDLYLRPFPIANQKVTWCLLILCTGGIGWLIYVFKYALKPRPQSTATSESN